MKSVRILFIVFIFVVSILSLFSCMDNDDYKPIDYKYVTVQEYMGTIHGLAIDFSDVVLVPSAASLANSNYLQDVERMLVCFTLEDGQVIDENTKRINIDIIPAYSSIIPTKSLCNMPDTLTNDSINKFNELWADKGYITATIELDNSARLPYADMVKEKVSNDTLYLRSNYKINKGIYSVSYPFSFRLPNKTDLEREEIKTVNDSIVIAVSANVREGSGSKVVTKYTKYKL